ncbi:MAG: hypothetical protein QOF34_694 [Sphingomonadales bacterium]|nr:hypothetical protein [Sphingomonadales bacterium]
MTGPILLLIGVVALFAAIVGGGVKIKEIEVGSVPSLWRQIMLGIFGLVVGLIGLILMMGPDEKPAANVAEVENVSAGNEGEAEADQNDAAANAAGEGSGETNAVEGEDGATETNSAE